MWNTYINFLKQSANEINILMLNSKINAIVYVDGKVVFLWKFNFYCK